LKLGILWVSYLGLSAVPLPKGLSKLEAPGLSAPEAVPVCERRWGTLEAVMPARREVLDDDEVAAEGRVCRVQARRAGPADAGTGRILSGRERGEVFVVVI